MILQWASFGKIKYLAANWVITVNIFVIIYAKNGTKNFLFNKIYNWRYNLPTILNTKH